MSECVPRALWAHVTRQGAAVCAKYKTKNKKTKKENKNCWGHNKNVMSLCKPRNLCVWVCVWPSRGDRARTLDQVQKVLTAAGLIFLCVCCFCYFIVCHFCQPTNKHTISTSPPSPLCSSFVLLFFARHYFYFNVVCFSQLRFSWVRFSSVRLG